jgi:hypothetical protein
MMVFNKCRLRLLLRASLVIVAVLATDIPAARSADEEPVETPKREQIGEVFGKAVYRDEIQTDSGAQLEDELHRLFLTPVAERYRNAHEDEITPSNDEIATFVKATMARKALEDKQQQEHDKKLNERVSTNPDLRRYREEIERQLARTDISSEDRKELEEQRRAWTGRTSRDELNRLRAEMSGGVVGQVLTDFFVFRSMASNWKYQRHLYDRYDGGRLLWQQFGMEAYDATRRWLEAEEKTGHFKISDPELRTKFYEYWNSQGKPFLIDDPAAIQEYLEPAKFLEAVAKSKNQEPDATANDK